MSIEGSSIEYNPDELLALADADLAWGVAFESSRELDILLSFYELREGTYETVAKLANERLEKEALEAELAETNARLEAETAGNIRREAEYAKIIVRLHEMVTFLMEDPLMNGALTRRGLELLLRDNNTNPRGELIQRAINNRSMIAAFIDVRFLNKINNEYDHSVGDIYLGNSHAEIEDEMDHLGRFGKAEPDEQYEGLEREQSDFIIRHAGDEIVIIFTGINPDHIDDAATAIEDHLKELLSIDAGVERDQNGQPPLMASVGVAHMRDPAILGDIRAALFDDQLPFSNRMLRVFDIVRDLADKRQGVARTAQYAEMLNMLEPVLDLGEMPPDPDDKRGIAKLFFEKFFPNFAQNIATIQDDLTAARARQEDLNDFS